MRKYPNSVSSYVLKKILILSFLVLGISFSIAASNMIRKMPQIGQKEEPGIIPYKPGGPEPRNIPDPTPPAPPSSNGRSLPTGETEPAYLVVEEGKDEKGSHLKVKSAHPEKGAPYKEGDKIYGPIDGKQNPLPEGSRE